MHVRSKLFAVATLALLVPGAARAQSTRQLLDSAKALYDAFQIEAARPIYQLIISAGYNRTLSSLEKAEAYKYLAASAAVVQAQADAVNYFQSALDFDPFTDLDPAKFADAEQAAFLLAKQKLFKVAMRPFTKPVLVQKDTASMRLRLELITTQRANVDVRLNGPDTVIIFQGIVDGPRAVEWAGLNQTTGDYAKPGTYQLRVAGTPLSGGQPPPPQETIVRVEHVVEPYEDTLPTLDPVRQLLPPRITTWEPWKDVGKGVAVAGIAVVVPLAALDAKQLSWGAHAGITAVIGAAAGTISYWYRKSNPEIRANVVENNVRQQARTDFNNAVIDRNRIRRERTKLIVSPVTGIGQ